MRKLITSIVALLVSLTALAQSPKEILESIRKYPNLAYPTASPYPGIPFGEIKSAPEGFEPFYFSLVGRHGSRYEQSDKYFRKSLKIFHKADSIGILTEEGKLLHKKIKEIFDAQQGNDGELSPLGFEQWTAIGERAYNNFKTIFDSGSVEAKSSTVSRCVFSMISFSDGLKGMLPSIKISQNARLADQRITRPLKHEYNPDLTKEADAYIKKQIKLAPWHEARAEWQKRSDFSSFFSKVSTDPEALVTKCGETSPFTIAHSVFTSVNFANNFGCGDSELVNRLFTPEELYRFYVVRTSNWVNGSVGRGNEVVEAQVSYMRPLAEDILNKAEAAIKGENPDVANIRFTHDSYIAPLYSAMGYEGCIPQWNENLELATTAFNYGTIVPMASNLQIVLYRNKKGEVLVRSLINERDGYLPIECKTAPFYPWEVFCKYVNNSMDDLDKSRDKVLAKMGK
jgi:hypothetical protein